MVKRHLSSITLGVLFVTVAVIVCSANWVAAQDTRSIVPYPRDVVVEAVDPVSKVVMRSYCIGPNAIDIKLTNNSGYRKYVYVINRDTRGVERTLYRGWLESGTQYLSTLLGTQFELSGPEGTEMVRADVSEYGQVIPGNWVSFYVRNCGGTGPGPWPPGPWPGHAQVWARVYPYAIEQGKKGTITLQTTVESRQNMTYYFEILNSWGQLWKRIPVNKRPYERYQLTLPVGKNTKPGMLTYTVKLWLESGFQGERRNVATTRVSFRVVTPGSAPSQYESGYPGYPGYPGYSNYPDYQQGWTPYSGTPYSEMQQPYYGTYPYSYGTSPYESSPYGTSYYGTGYYPGSPVGERQIQ